MTATIEMDKEYMVALVDILDALYDMLDATERITPGADLIRTRSIVNTASVQLEEQLRQEGLNDEA